MQYIKEKRKAKNRPRASRLWFVTGWLLIGIASLFIPNLIFSLLPSGPFALFWLYWPLHILFLSGLQFLWLRHALGISLRLWAPLAVLGALFTSLLTNLPIMTSSIQADNFLFIESYWALLAFISHSTPLIFQWPALRRRFQKSWLWLLAALAFIPFSHHFWNDRGLLSALLEGISGPSTNAGWGALSFVTYLLDELVPFALTGLALYHIITKSGDTVALRSGVETQAESDAEYTRLALHEPDEDALASENSQPELAGAKQLTSAQ